MNNPIDTTDAKWVLEFHHSRIHKYTDDEILNVINETPFVLSLIKNPKNEWVIAAAKMNPSLLGAIEKPPVDLQAMVIAQSPYNVQYINNLDDDLALELLKNKPEMIHYIRNPSEIVSNYAKIIE